MRDYRDAKSMAQTLRDVLSEKSISLNHSESLEIIAKAFGVRDWNTLSAAIGTRPHTSSKAATGRLRKRTTIPALPLRDVVFFPNTVASLYAGRKKSIRALEQSIQGGQAIVLITQKDADADCPEAIDLYRVGVLASVLHTIESPDGGVVANIHALQRVAVEQFSAAGDFYEAAAVPIEEAAGDRERTRALSQELHRQYQVYAQTQSPKLSELLVTADIDPGHLADVVTVRLRLPIAETQAFLETTSVAKRLENLLALVKQDRSPSQ